MFTSARGFGTGLHFIGSPAELSRAKRIAVGWYEIGYPARGRRHAFTEASDQKFKTPQTNKQTNNIYI